MQNGAREENTQGRQQDREPQRDERRHEASFGWRLRCGLSRVQSRIRECLPGSAQRAFGRHPQVERNARYGFNRHTPFREVRRRRAAQYQERSYDDGFGAVPLQLGVRGSDRGTGADRVVDDGEALVAHAASGGPREMILRLVQPLSFPGHHALRGEELDLEGRGEHLGEERAADEWPAHTRDLVWSKRSGEAGDERMNGGRLNEQALEIEPEVRVVTRFEPEVAVPG